MPPTPPRLIRRARIYGFGLAGHFSSSATHQRQPRIRFRLRANRAPARTLSELFLFLDDRKDELGHPRFAGNIARDALRGSCDSTKLGRTEYRRLLDTNQQTRSISRYLSMMSIIISGTPYPSVPPELIATTNGTSI